jgi:hypothetical protein
MATSGLATTRSAARRTPTELPTALTMIRSYSRTAAPDSDVALSNDAAPSSIARSAAVALVGDR